MKKLILFIVILSFQLRSFGQDTIYVNQVMRKLCSSELAGRGYVTASDKKTAYYVQEEFNKFGLKAFDSTTDRTGVTTRKFTQPFKIAINTFPDLVMVKYDKKTMLKPGKDYILEPSCPDVPVMTTYQVLRLDKKHIKSEKAFDEFVFQDYSKNVIVIDPELFKKEIEAKNEFYPRVLKNEMKADAIVILEPTKLTFGVSSSLDKYPVIHILKSKFPATTKEVIVQINNNYNPNYETQNVVGMVKGKLYPDSIVVIGAHYDHLGRMGKDIFFQGANDNASGVAMLLDLAKYYADPFNQPNYSIVFIAFGAEELGLIGSTYFTEHPLFPLSKIFLMINLDMMGTGEKGMMVVNAKKNNTEFNKLKTINTQKKYLTEIQSRGPSANSDHHPFDVKGVKAMYFYLMGNYPYYHELDDNLSNLKMKGYVGSFKLIVDFLNSLKK